MNISSDLDCWMDSTLRQLRERCAPSILCPPPIYTVTDTHVDWSRQYEPMALHENYLHFYCGHRAMQAGRPISTTRPTPRWRQIKNKILILRGELRHRRWLLSRRIRRNSLLLKKIVKFLSAGITFFFGIINMMVGLQLSIFSFLESDFLFGIFGYLYAILICAFWTGLAMDVLGYKFRPEPEPPTTYLDIDATGFIYTRPYRITHVDEMPQRRIRDSDGLTLADDDKLGW